MAPAADGAPKPRRRLLHTSDVHLGGYDTGPEYKREEVEATFRQRWVEQRVAQLKAQKVADDAARAQAEAEFREKFEYLQGKGK